MGLETNKTSSFSELLDELVEVIQTGDLSIEQMNKRNDIKQRLIDIHNSKIQGLNHSWDHQPMGSHWY